MRTRVQDSATKSFSYDDHEQIVDAEGASQVPDRSDWTATVRLSVQGRAEKPCRTVNIGTTAYDDCRGPGWQVTTKPASTDVVRSAVLAQVLEENLPKLRLDTDVLCEERTCYALILDQQFADGDPFPASPARNTRSTWLVDRTSLLLVKYMSVISYVPDGKTRTIVDSFYDYGAKVEIKPPL